jgi:topoisomerase-4 subunit A
MPSLLSRPVNIRSASGLCEDNKPLFIGVSDMLKISTNRTVGLLKSELEIQLSELEEQWHFLSLERIFIENKIYRDIEEKTTRETLYKQLMMV